MGLREWFEERGIGRGRERREPEMTAEQMAELQNAPVRQPRKYKVGVIPEAVINRAKNLDSDTMSEAEFDAAYEKADSEAQVEQQAERARLKEEAKALLDKHGIVGGLELAHALVCEAFDGSGLAEDKEIALGCMVEGMLRVEVGKDLAHARDATHYAAQKMRNLDIHIATCPERAAKTKAAAEAKKD